MCTQEGRKGSQVRQIAAAAAGVENKRKLKQQRQWAEGRESVAIRRGNKEIEGKAEGSR